MVGIRRLRLLQGAAVALILVHGVFLSLPFFGIPNEDMGMILVFASMLATLALFDRHEVTGLFFQPAGAVILLVILLKCGLWANESLHWLNVGVVTWVIGAIRSLEIPNNESTALVYQAFLLLAVYHTERSRRLVPNAIDPHQVVHEVRKESSRSGEIVQ